MGFGILHLNQRLTPNGFEVEAMRIRWCTSDAFPAGARPFGRASKSKSTSEGSSERVGAAGEGRGGRAGGRRGGVATAGRWGVVGEACRTCWQRARHTARGPSRALRVSVRASARAWRRLAHPAPSVRRGPQRRRCAPRERAHEGVPRAGSPSGTRQPARSLGRQRRICTPRARMATR